MKGKGDGGFMISIATYLDSVNDTFTLILHSRINRLTFKAQQLYVQSVKTQKTGGTDCVQLCRNTDCVQ